MMSEFNQSTCAHQNGASALVVRAKHRAGAPFTLDRPA